jgi:hypothetical protein
MEATRTRRTRPTIDETIDERSAGDADSGFAV